MTSTLAAAARTAPAGTAVTRTATITVPTGGCTVSRRRSAPRPPAAACPLELRALRTGTRALAEAVTGIALDAPCSPGRRRAVLDVARLVLRGVLGTAGRRDDAAVHVAAVRAAGALPVFAHDVSAGAPALARTLTDLADLLDRRAAAGGGHEHGRRASPVPCERRFRSTAGRSPAVVAWFLDAASPAERVRIVAGGPRRVRWALRLGEARYLRAMAQVRGTAE